MHSEMITTVNLINISIPSYTLVCVSCLPPKRMCTGLIFSHFHSLTVPTVSMTFQLILMYGVKTSEEVHTYGGRRKCPKTADLFRFQPVPIPRVIQELF